MAQIGIINQLTITGKKREGLILDGEELGELFLPNKQTEQYEVNSIIDVFLFTDSNGSIVPTFRKPKIQLGEFAYLKVVSSSSMGAFLEWGMTKDLFVPISGQQDKMIEGNSYIVYLYLDEQDGRLIAASKINRYLNLGSPVYNEGDEVDLLICDETDLGYNVIVDNAFRGILYKNEVFSELQIGMKTKGFIKKVRDDEKIDLSLNAAGYRKIGGLAGKILSQLEQEGGFLPLTDKSPPEEIYKTFGESKKSFKKAIGALYKERRISIDKDGIRIIKTIQE